jgi:hypothetical protein
MAVGLLLSSSVSVNGGGVRFRLRSHRDYDPPFVVLYLGADDATMHVYDLETLIALAAMVAEARELLGAALTGETARVSDMPVAT